MLLGARRAAPRAHAPVCEDALADAGVATDLDAVLLRRQRARLAGRSQKQLCGREPPGRAARDSIAPAPRSRAAAAGAQYQTAS